MKLLSSLLAISLLLPATAGAEHEFPRQEKGDVLFRMLENFPLDMHPAIYVRYAGGDVSGGGPTILELHELIEMEGPSELVRDLTLRTFVTDSGSIGAYRGARTTSGPLLQNREGIIAQATSAQLRSIRYVGTSALEIACNTILWRRTVEDGGNGDNILDFDEIIGLRSDMWVEYAYRRAGIQIQNDIINNPAFYIDTDCTIASDITPSDQFEAMSQTIFINPLVEVRTGPGIDDPLVPDGGVTGDDTLAIHASDVLSNVSIVELWQGDPDASPLVFRDTEDFFGLVKVSQVGPLSEGRYTARVFDQAGNDSHSSFTIKRPATFGARPTKPSDSGMELSTSLYDQAARTFTGQINLKLESSEGFERVDIRDPVTGALINTQLLSGTVAPFSLPPIQSSVHIGSHTKFSLVLRDIEGNAASTLVSVDFGVSPETSAPLCGAGFISFGGGCPLQGSLINMTRTTDENSPFQGSIHVRGYYGEGSFASNTFDLAALEPSVLPGAVMLSGSVFNPFYNAAQPDPESPAPSIDVVPVGAGLVEIPVLQTRRLPVVPDDQYRPTASVVVTLNGSTIWTGSDQAPFGNIQLTGLSVNDALPLNAPYSLGVSVLKALPSSVIDNQCVERDPLDPSFCIQWRDYTPRVTSLGSAAIGQLVTVSVGDPMPSLGTGENVVVRPNDDVEITFPAITSPGTVTAARGPQRTPPGYVSSPPDSAQFITASVGFTGPATLKMKYTDPGFTPEQLAGLRLVKITDLNTLAFQDVTASVDTTNRVITGAVTAFSPFMVIAPSTFTAPPPPADTTPPVTTLSFIGPSSEEQNQVRIGTQTLIQLSAQDPSGIAFTRFLVDMSFVDFQSTPGVDYTGPFNLPAGSHTLTYYSRDNAGNFETPQQASLLVEQSTGTGGGGDPPPPPPPIDNGRTTALARDGPGNLWSIVNRDGSFTLEKFDTLPARLSQTPLPAASDSDWSLSFDQIGNVYAVGSSNPTQQEDADQLTVYQVSPQGSLLSTAHYPSAAGFNDFTLDSTGDVWIAGAIQDQTAGTFKLGLWRYDPQVGQIQKVAEYSRGHGLDGAFGLSLHDGSLWVAGYSQNASGGVDLALWRFGLDGALIGSPSFITAADQFHDHLKASVSAEPEGVFVAAASHLAGETDLRFLKFSLTGELLSHRLWRGPAGRVERPADLVRHGAQLAVAGRVNDTGTVWRYGLDGSFVAAETMTQLPPLSSAASLFPDLWVGAGPLPLRFQNAVAVPGEDVLLFAQPPPPPPPSGDLALLQIVGGKDILQKPHDVALGKGLIVAADTNADRLVLFNEDGTQRAVYGQAGRKVEPHFNKPHAVEVDSQGNLYAADTGHHRIVKLSPEGQLLLELGDIRQKKGVKHFHADSGPGQFRRPKGLAVGNDGTIYVADTGNRRVQVFSASGSFLRQFDLPETDLAWPPDPEAEDEDADCEPGRRKRGAPFGLAVDSSGRVYAADPKGRRALRFEPDGTLSAAYQAGFTRPEGVAVSPDGATVLVSDRVQDRLQEFDAQGNARRSLTGQGMKRPIGLALAHNGLWVADRNNDRLLRFGPASANQAPVLSAPKPAKKPLHASAKIERLKPGKVIREDGARVELPAGALEEELDISVSEVGDADPDRQSKEAKRQAASLRPASPEVEYGPEGLLFALPVTISLPYDPAAGLDVATLKVHYWNPKTKQWEALDSVLDAQRRLVSAQTTHFSLYQVLGAGGGVLSGGSWDLGQVYAYPNPVKGQSPRFHVEAAGADSVTIRVYDVSGALVHEASPPVGQDHLWNVSGVGSGVYHYVVTAKRGAKALTKRGKLAVLK